MKAWDDEEDEVHEKAEHLHLFAAVEFIVNEKGLKTSSVSSKSWRWQKRGLRTYRQDNIRKGKRRR